MAASKESQDGDGGKEATRDLRKVTERHEGLPGYFSVPDTGDGEGGKALPPGRKG